VIPCWNHGTYRRFALQSVAAQTYARHETIVIDDGSTDDTPRIATDRGAQLFAARERRPLR
jgi:glycosyltransferase involved in cell wall biosynthesis